MENQAHIRQLLNKYLDKQCTAKEIRQLLSYFNVSSNEAALKSAILAAFEQMDNEAKVNEDQADLAIADVRQQLFQKIGQQSDRKLKRLTWRSIAAAAAVLLFLSVSTYFIFQKPKLKPGPVPVVVSGVKHDIAPGGNKAVLILANGQQIVLSAAKNGKLAQQGQTNILKTADGQVMYHAMDAINEPAEPAAIAYNTLKTPIGGQYDLTLSDGTRVWLNAASSITYPVEFTGNERNVNITGEAYFEVAHNAAKPFHVNSDGQTVEVLGTHFNINAYADEPILKTTLFEGSIRIARNGQSAILKPGQQAQVKNNSASSGIVVTRDVNTEEAIAWKNGYFLFYGENIESIMRKVSRWYNVDIAYEKGIPDETFGGSISRFKNVSQLLNVLQRTGSVHFKVEGRRITVMK